MFRKHITTISNGEVVTEQGESVAANDVQRDMAEERRRVSKMAQGERSRIASIEVTMTTMVITYAHGAVRVYQWVAEAE